MLSFFCEFNYNIITLSGRKCKRKRRKRKGEEAGRAGGVQGKCGENENFCGKEHGEGCERLGKLAIITYSISRTCQAVRLRADAQECTGATYKNKEEGMENKLSTRS